MFKYTWSFKITQKVSYLYININNITKSPYISNKYKKFNELENSKSINLTNLTNAKHYPPATREWNNSVYNFNKNNPSYSLTKHNQLNDLLKNYFNISNKAGTARSKRMRYLRRKSTPNKTYLSKSEIKQTNDKVVITVYYFDRNTQVLTRKLLYYNRPKIYDTLSMYKKRKRMIIINNSVNYNLSFSGIKYLKELKLFRKKNIYRYKRLEQTTWFQLYKYILSLFNVHIITPLFFSFVVHGKDNKWQFYSKRKIKKINKDMITKIVELKPQVLYWVNYYTCSIDKIENKDINYKKLTEKLAEERKSLSNKKLNNNIYFNFKGEINNKLLYIVNKYLGVNKVDDITIRKIFNDISFRINKQRMLQEYKRGTKKVSRVLDLLGYNLFRFKMLLPSLKNLIDSLYNKKTVLNLVNLKYFYLNSDILTQILIFKIQKKVNSLTLLRSTLTKINLSAESNNYLPKERSLDRNMKPINIYNNLNFLNLNGDLSLKNLFNVTNVAENSLIRTKDNNLNGLLYKYNNNFSFLSKKEQEFRTNKDKLDLLFYYFYPKNFIQHSRLYKNDRTTNSKQLLLTNSESKAATILNMIKYKWILGVWIEAKGRLTRRNTAARSVLNRVYKGNLKDKDQYVYLNKITSVSPVILRNDMRSNTQYTSKGSFKRVGTFGIKTWISSK